MKTKGCYYVILIIYISLWTCQLIVGHLTHSLIVLVDSYINLYKILDVSLGILHLSKQLQIKKRDKETTGDNEPPTKLFGHNCTYDLKRLPVLGAFVNGLFLAALLLSAAIEGVQTCFHVGHLSGDSETSILMEHHITYPGILVGFAFVGVVMQWCSSKTHEMREEELQSESLLDLGAAAPATAGSVPMLELSAGHLRRSMTVPPNKLFRGRQKNCCAVDKNDDSNKRNTIGSDASQLQKALEFKKLDAIPAADSFETVPLDDQSYGDELATKNSLNSLKSGDGTTKLDKSGMGEKIVNSISKDVESKASESKTAPTGDTWWRAVRYCSSPFALLACALIFYFINDGKQPTWKSVTMIAEQSLTLRLHIYRHTGLITEIADATLAIIVVVLLFTSSFPPSKSGISIDKLSHPT